MLSLSTDVVENAIFVPRGLISDHDVVYDQHGALVTDSCVRRGSNRQNNFSQAPEQLPEKFTPTTVFKTQALFLGPYDMTHYGHWLTEGVARLWFLQNETNSDYPILTGTTRPQSMSRRIYDVLRRQTPYWVKGLAALEVDSQRFRFCPKPVRVSKMIVPSCSIYLRNGIHPAHLTVTRALGKGLCKKPVAPSSSVPVYLSRAKLKDQISMYKGQEEVDDFCRDQGFRVIFPETLSLEEQIAIFNQHDTFIGFFGSAFHTLMLRWRETSAMNIFLGPENPNPTYFYIDQLMGNTTHHINCCNVIEDLRLYECDPKRAIAGIQEAMTARS